MMKKKYMFIIMNTVNIVSPCVSVCKSDPITGFCYGCGRTDSDKSMWKDPQTSNEWRQSNLETLKNRLNGWQKEAWEKSYTYKKENGISLLKKNIIEKNKQ